MITGTNMSVWKSLVGTPYQPTTSGRVISESMVMSIQR
jgi:muramoyltetrapeptide carboxypeptidase LdcA involved in peptidoglycan recycling